MPNKLYVLLICVTLAIVTFIAFEQVRHNEFVNYDDDKYVTDNPQVNGGITRESVIWAFTSSHVANWHPLTSLSHMLDCQLFGLNPSRHHMSSLLFHIANTLLLFLVLKRMTGAFWPSGFVAAAFALHPLHVESVAWVAERKDVLSGFFWMLTMLAYVRYAERATTGRYLLVVLALCLGLMSKPMLVTLPFVLLLLDYWPLGRLQRGHQSRGKALSQSKSVKGDYQRLPARRLIAEKIPLFVLVAVSGVVTYIVQQSGGAMRNVGKLPLNFRIANALVSYIGYIGKMIYPTRLAALYPYPINRLPLWQPIVSFVILAGVSAVIIYTARRWRYLAVGWLWYLGTLVPVIGLVQVGSQAMADRYTYLPSIGIFIIVAWGFAELDGKWRYKKISLGVSAGIVLAALLICTRMQVRHWQNNFTLFGHTLAVTENNSIMHNNYGNTLRKKGQLEEAVTHFNEALRINPQYFVARDNISQTFLKLGRIEEAIAGFTEVLRLKPDYANAANNLGVALQKQGKINEAIEKWEKALELEPKHPDAHYNMGLAMAKQGKYNKAIKHFKKALEARADWPGPYNDLGLAYTQLGKYELAIQNYKEALRLEPGYLKAHYNLGGIYYRQGKLKQTVSHWTETVKLKPDFVEVLGNLAWILATSKDTKIRNSNEAVKYAERACELTDYKQPGTLNTLAVAYAAADRFPEAVATAEKALKLAQSLEQNELAEKIRKRLELYKSAQPYIEPLKVELK